MDREFDWKMYLKTGTGKRVVWKIRNGIPTKRAKKHRRTESVFRRTGSVPGRTKTVLGRTKSVFRRTESVFRRTDLVLLRKKPVLG